MRTSKTVDEIPAHLRPYVAKQDASLYTPIDHAVWRFILKLSQSFFAKHAHEKYLNGLKQTGISVERIPLIAEMDECLRRYHWRAVAVSGFIPPAAFMEFLSLGILPIACDMRNLANIAYTPAPDIVHEAAGHAPIIADPDYSAYLKGYGEISQKAIFSSEDMEVYQAIRNLSDIKEDLKSTPEIIAAAQERLNRAVAAQTYVSEATLLSRMGWWTFEYGLIGSIQQPKIFGAGLLSSIGESYHCFDPQVSKIPFSIDCINVTYDITRPQPQLFVTPNFQTLGIALEQLANQMAFRRGGTEGLAKAKKAQTITTTQLNTGIQISGILSEFRVDPTGKPFFIKFSGPTQLSYQNQELEGQGTTYHRDGFSTPLAVVTEETISQADLRPGKMGRIDLSSGISVQGRMTGLLRRAGEPILLSFENCTVRAGDELLFQPSWGKFDMACGSEVVSVFGGPADREKYLKDTGGYHQEPGRQKTNLTEQNRALNQLYAELRNIRETAKFDEAALDSLSKIHRELEKHHQDDWLLRYELLELAQQKKLQLGYESDIRKGINLIAATASNGIKETIQRGMEIL